MSRTISYFLFAFALGCVVGCTDATDDRTVENREPGLYVDTTRHASIIGLRPDDVVVRVNGDKITKRDFVAQMKLKEWIWSFRVGSELPTDGELERTQVESGQWIVYELMHHALFRQYARRLGIVPSESDIERARQNLLKSLKKPGASIDDLANTIGGDAGRLFKEIPYVDAQDLLLRQTVTTNSLTTVSEEELEARRAFVASFDANADAMNKIQREKLLKAKAEIDAGADFAEVTRRYAEVFPEYGEKWGTFILAEMASEEDLHNWLASAKVGDISGPVDTDDGMAIVKLVATGKGDAPPGIEPPDTYTMVRCTVKACERMRYQDRAEMTQQLLIWKNQEAQQKLGQKLLSEAVIEYPNGTNLFERVAGK